MRQRRLMNQINVVPYIDVMLVLLVIFMVTAPMIQPGTVDLPSVGKSNQSNKPNPLEVVIHEDQRLGLRDRSAGGKEVAMTRSELLEAVKAAQARNAEQPVLIAADKSVRYEWVMNMMDDLQRQQISHISLLVQSGK